MLRGIVFVSVVAALAAMGVAAAWPQAGEVAVACGLAVSLAFALVASRPRTARTHHAPPSGSRSRRPEPDLDRESPRPAGA